MNNQNLFCIENTANQKLFYRFTPAAVVSNFVPLVVVLHGEENTKAINFEYKMWNMLTPLDYIEYEHKDLLQELIKQIAEEYDCEDHIYLYGGYTTGGYRAILHGILCKANAVFTYTPRIKLLDTNSKESDLANFLNSTDSLPIFYLCDNESNPENNTAYFVDACNQKGIKVHLDFCPNFGEDEIHRLKEVLNFFERVASEA